MSEPQTDVSKIAERIKKLLGLSTSNNANEAASALEQAQRLMQMHKLSEADVSSMTGDGSDIIDLPMGSEGFMASWKFALVTAVARAFFCEAVGLRVKKRRKIRVFGKADDVKTVQEVFGWALKEMERLATVELERLDVRDLIEGGFIDRAKYREQFLIGAAMGLGEKLKKKDEEFARSSEKAMVLVNKNKEELRSAINVKLGDNNRETIIIDRSDEASQLAHTRGYAQGLEIQIVRGGGGGEPEKLLKSDS
jgi:hypothetical protein